jgi:nucleoid-associated protein YgaU
MSRYDSSDIGINEEELYEEFFEERNVKRIEQYRTPNFPILTAQVRGRFSKSYHTWTMGDSFWKLAAKYYGNEQLWWVIAWYNEKPTESHVKPGGTLVIPYPAEEVISYFHYGA